MYDLFTTIKVHVTMVERGQPWSIIISDFITVPSHEGVPVVYLFLRYRSVLSCVDTGSTMNDLNESDSAEPN